MARSVGLALLFGLGVAFISTAISAGPASASSGRAPAAATSFYMRTTNPQTLNRMGCRMGSRVVHGSEPEDALVVMAFGSPRHHRVFGTSLYGRGFVSTSQIKRAGLRYAQGFARCTKKRRQASLRIALGTSNYGPQVGFHHGVAWAQMVNGANDDLARLGLSGRIDITGANDIEPGWSGPRAARAWVRGYDTVNRWPYYNFGGAAGCPPFGDCLGWWTVEDVWYVSWGAAPALPLPEIYTRSGISAKQWYHLSLYSATRHGSTMTIAGVMSQHRACRQTPDPCRGMNNTPPRAWRQLSTMLNADHRTAQSLHWVTDISWTK